MPKTKIILSIIAVILVIGLFLLPKVVVDNEENTAMEGTAERGESAAIAEVDSKDPQLLDTHNPQLSSENEEIIFSLREKLRNSTDKEKNIIFADSLAAVFKNNSLLDSAAKYKALVADISPSKERFISAGDSYYEAFSFSVNPEKTQALAEEARKYYTEALTLSDEAESRDIKTKVAMTHIASSNPMKGIGMLREVIEEDPGHEDALFNLGILSLQSNQPAKAVDRFETLVALYPENLQGQFYLGLSYLESGKKKEAKEQLEKVKSLDKDPEVQAAVDGYLEEI